MALEPRKDPYRGFNFRLEIGGLTVASFSEVSGLVAEGEAVPYREGDEGVNWPRQLIGQRKFNHIVLKRGYTRNKELWDWYGKIANGINDRRDGAIVLMDEGRKDVVRWEFVKAWPNKVEGATLHAANNEVAMESVELVHEGLQMKLAG
jgi:phage tail-like protein|uniref:phage tail protein n=1 Tax=uncultured Sphingomonas sp. TaxID=158754 RepID=UPI0035CB95A7